MAPQSTGLAANRSAAQALPGQAPLAVKPCPHCLKLVVYYKPTLDGSHPPLRTYKPHTVAGPETRKSTARFDGNALHEPVTPGSYTLSFQFTREDLRFADLSFTAVMYAAP